VNSRNSVCCGLHNVIR
jgi:hypothetical protein